MQETGFQFLGWEDPLEEEIATYPSVLAWRIPGTVDREAWRAVIKVRRGGGEEIPLVQGKEQRLRFAEAAVQKLRDRPGTGPSLEPSEGA